MSEVNTVITMFYREFDKKYCNYKNELVLKNVEILIR